GWGAAWGLGGWWPRRGRGGERPPPTARRWRGRARRLARVIAARLTGGVGRAVPWESSPRVRSWIRRLERHAARAGVRRRGALGRGVLQRHHVPGAAEGVDALALGRLGLGVEREAVERQAGRGDLVGGAGRAELLDALGGLHLGARGDRQRRPRGHARSGACDV